MAGMQVHASAVAVGEAGLLILGGPGSGKSDLALRLIDRGALLVADDRVDLAVADGRLVATAPPPLLGLIEMRGVGIVERPVQRAAALALAVHLGQEAERLPRARTVLYLGVALPVLFLPAFEAATPLKVEEGLRLALAGRLFAHEGPPGG